MGSNNRIVRNSLFLYGRMALSIFLAFFTTRIILHSLGLNDFGIFNLVAGVIALLSFLNLAMTVSTQRYLSHFIGAGLSDELKKVFKASVQIHLLLALAIVSFLWLAEPYVFDRLLNIDKGRVDSAKTIYCVLIFSTFIAINSVPYDALINSHEDLWFDAILGVVESILKLVIAFILNSYEGDRLVLYGVLITMVTVFVRFSKSLFCVIRYQEYRITIKKYLSIDFEIFKEMLFYSTWNVFGSLAYVCRSQGVAIVVNMFFGTLMNAAYAIANQVNSHLVSLSGNMIKAVNPQIMKTEGGGNRNKMVELSLSSCRFSYLLLAFSALPFMFEMPYFLKIWLNEFPPFTVIFCQIIIVNSLINQLTRGLQSAIQSIGEIKYLQLLSGGLVVLALLLGYLLLQSGFPPYSVLTGITIMEVCVGAFCIKSLNKHPEFSCTEYFRKVILKVLPPTMVSILSLVCIQLLLEEGFVRFSFSFIFSIGCFFVIAFRVSLLKHEQEYLERKLLQAKCRFLKNKTECS